MTMDRIHATPNDVIEYRHLMDPYDYDGGPWQCLAPGRPADDASGATATLPDYGYHPATERPAVGRTAVPSGGVL